ncbi:mitochondrial large subunit ribosomal protein-domain-containing protein [Elsinoe ampelina]|uniref:Large ribosomal subunit protein mL49 n=1 Tax=Elsinoe ampelina TaxID=302913 RepID=A0A6A6G345_9PEZI|nr:mitochondrial large subunit ribosomal protein-domain-containing protein [Elsinoe ampelina]
MPLPAPRPVTVHSFLRRLQSTSAHTKVTEDPNLVASRTAPKSYPPPSLKSQPRPKESRASHRTSQPTRIKNYPDQQVSQRNNVRTEPTDPLPETQCAPQLPYFVTRTPSNELPVYQFHKAGGNKKLTRIRKIDGNLEALRDAVQSEFKLKKEDCTINSLTRQVIVKGHVKQEIEAFLQARRF